ncbi:MAG: helix-turn-helix transcriptional regulator [Proteobacteria bacterium]|nr:helix-turn-helix transcriptional regulator [Pseudomonadota bacterium]
MNKTPHQVEGDENEYVPFVLADYIHNPVSLARIENRLTRKQLAERLGITVGYLGKIERQDEVKPALVDRVSEAIRRKSA